MTGNWLDDLLAADIYVNGSHVQPRAAALDFLGAVAAQYNLTTKRMEVRLSASTWKDSIRALKNSALPAYTRTGNSYQADANGAFPAVDGVTLAVGDAFLYSNGSHVDNGPLELTDLGSASAPWAAIRRADFDEDADIARGAVFYIREGTVNHDKLFKLDTDAPTLNTTALIFSALTGGGGGLSAPANPGDNGKIAIGNLADLSYVGGSAVGQCLRWTGSGAAFGALDLADTDAVTGVLPIANLASAAGNGQHLQRLAGANAWSDVLTLAEKAALTTPGAGLGTLGILQASSSLQQRPVFRNSDAREHVLAPFPTHRALVATTDATLTTGVTYTMADNSILKVGTRISARQTGGSSNILLREATAVFKRVAGGAATLLGTVLNGTNVRDDAVWTSVIDASGNDVRIRVQGKAATNINWEVEGWLMEKALP